MKNNNRFHIILVLVLSLVSINANAAAVSGQGTWETTLQGRDLDGNPSTVEGYYDTALNITWMANANVAGAMDWGYANAWASGLNINGITGWRLPTVNPVNGSSFDYSNHYDGSTDRGANISAPGTVYAGSTGSEMAHMFYITLGDKAEYTTSGTLQGGSGLTNAGPFSNIQSGIYWSATEYPCSSCAFLFTFNTGYQNAAGYSGGFYSWAVHSGSVGASVVPIPAAFWLFGSGLVGLFGCMSRRNGSR